MATTSTNQTPNYALSQYVATDPVKFLTNYNSDMSAIDTSLKSVSNVANGAVPTSRKIADMALSSDITLAQLIAKGLASGDTSGNAINALSLGGILASRYQLNDTAQTQTLTLLNGWAAGWGTLDVWRFGRVVTIAFNGVFSGTSGAIIATLPTGWNPNGAWIQSASSVSIALEGENIRAGSSSIDRKTGTFIL